MKKKKQQNFSGEHFASDKQAREFAWELVPEHLYWEALKHRGMVYLEPDAITELEEIARLMKQPPSRSRE